MGGSVEHGAQLLPDTVYRTLMIVHRRSDLLDRQPLTDEAQDFQINRVQLGVTAVDGANVKPPETPVEPDALGIAPVARVAGAN